MIYWDMIKHKVSNLKEHPKNPRQLTKDQEKQLKESIKKFGMIDKPIINTDMMIIGGHQRLKILKQLKIKEIECWYPSRKLTEQEVDELNIRLNKNTGEWDWDVLANEWNTSDLVDWGFNPVELLGESIEDLGSNDTDEDSEILEPAKDEDAVTKLGDVYEMEGHYVGCGDSTDADFVALLIGEKEPILMVTDPPYGVGYDPSWRDPSKMGHDGIRTKVKSRGKVKNDDRVNWAQVWHLFSGSVAYIWHSSLHTKEVYQSLIEAEYEIISNIIWAKQHFAISRGDYHWQHEPCWYAVKKGHKHNWQGARDQSTLWEISNLSSFGKNVNEGEECTSHGTQKPIDCMARPIKNNTEAGDYVYDPFLGSGTTLIAAEQLNRKCIGIEISPAYCDIIIQRWINYRVKKDMEAIFYINGEKITDIKYFEKKNGRKRD